MKTFNLEELGRLTFPDGQPHIKLPGLPDRIQARVTNPTELMELVMVGETLNREGIFPSLFLTYLMGGRMDRSIGYGEPFTLKVVTDILNTVNFSQIDVFDPHSEATINLLKAPKVNIVYNNKFIEEVMKYENGEEYIFVCPDKGATARVLPLSKVFDRNVIAFNKKREESTGKILSIEMEKWGYIKDRKYLIIDDLCDGGGTFAGIAKILLEGGARSVDLAVSHGVFSKGFTIPGINWIFTTNSYKNWISQKGLRVITDYA